MFRWSDALCIELAYGFQVSDKYFYLWKMKWLMCFLNMENGLRKFSLSLACRLIFPCSIRKSSFLNLKLM